MQVRIVKFLHEWTVAAILRRCCVALADEFFANKPLLSGNVLLISRQTLDQACAVGLVSLETLRTSFRSTHISLITLDFLIVWLFKRLMLLFDQILPKQLQVEIELAAEKFTMLQDVFLTDQRVK